jgi:hypothetical protein
MHREEPSRNGGLLTQWFLERVGSSITNNNGVDPAWRRENVHQIQATLSNLTNA